MSDTWVFVACAIGLSIGLLLLSTVVFQAACSLASVPELSFVKSLGVKVVNGALNAGVGWGLVLMLPTVAAVVAEVVPGLGSVFPWVIVVPALVVYCALLALLYTLILSGGYTRSLQVIGIEVLLSLLVAGLFGGLLLAVLAGMQLLHTPITERAVVIATFLVVGAILGAVVSIVVQALFLRLACVVCRVEKPEFGQALRICLMIAILGLFLGVAATVAANLTTPSVQAEPWLVWLACGAVAQVLGLLVYAAIVRSELSVSYLQGLAVVLILTVLSWAIAGPLLAARTWLVSA